MQLRELSEHEIQTDIMNLLWFHGFYVQRMNSGNIPITENGKKRLIKLMAAGTPDILAIKRGIAHFIEVKKPGNVPTRLQELKMQELSEYGAVCIVATSAEEVKEKLNL